ncbi:MAG: hypothetical protein AAGG01_18990, partial [Planctomycetota bacterium]
WAASLDGDGVPTGPSWKVTDVFGTQKISISSTNDFRLADGLAPYVIVYDSGPNFFGDLHAATCVGSTLRGEISNLSLQSDERRTNEQRRPAIAATSDRWLLVYQERELLGDWKTYMTSGRPAPEGFGLAERNQRMLLGSADQLNPALATEFQGGVSGEGGFAVWVNFGLETRVEGAFLESVPGRGAAGVQYCSAAPHSGGRRAWVSASGTGRATSFHTIRCSDAPPGSPCFVLTSREPGIVPNVGGGAGNLCLGGLGFGRFSQAVAPTDLNGVYELQFSPQSIAQPSGTIAASVGETWYFQAWFRDSSPAGPTSNLSNGVAVKFVN